MSLLLERRAMMKHGRLPSDYQEVAWIKSDGKAYINTNLLVSSVCRIKCQMSMSDYSAGGATKRFFGTWDNSVGDGLYTAARPAYTTWYFWRGGWYDTAVPCENNVIYDIDYNGLTDSPYLKINDTTIPISSLSTTQIPSPFMFFGSNNGGDNDANGLFTLSKDFVIEFSSGEAFHGIPCYRKNDGVIGVYDLAIQQFFTNAASTGSFTHGSNV